ncbi:MAG: single-stranded-DNA-specific exonuclease RecJ [Candidatus Omnitrophica bacterium]|nr:single-stranded-DNA-specific exonuclease RecJ [Candidatus Omnitrophota bacterium]
MITKWVIKEQPQATDSLIEYLQNNVQLDPIVIKLLLTRNLLSPLEIEKFINPKIEDLYDPFLMKGMKEAVCLLEETIAHHKRIMIHGDYDIDGVTSTGLLAKVFSKLKVDYITYIPDRLTEGYGLSKEAIDHAVREHVSLIITVDCGISAYDEVEYACQCGLQVIITDHHRPSEDKVPKAAAVVNPWQAGCAYPCKELTGVGIAFKVAQALTSKVDLDILDLVALGTVGDVANIIDENRIFVKYGLKTFEKRSNIGLHELRRVSGIEQRKIASSDLSFILGPRINATGRLGSAGNALKLLLTSDKTAAQEYATLLNDENAERQRIERQILEQALKQIDENYDLEKHQAIVLWDEHWHQGVIGIIASRLVERYHKPALIIAVEGGGFCKGSGRSIKGIDLFEALTRCSDLLEAFGGHEYAAGFEICQDNLEKFREKINSIIMTKYDAETFKKEIGVDLEITFYDINKTLVKNLELFKPFGRGNPKPIFLTRHLKLMSTPTKLRGGGAKFSLFDGEIIYDAIWFKPNGFELERDIAYDAVYCLGFDTWFGFEKIILEIKDLQVSEKSVIIGSKA